MELRILEKMCCPIDKSDLELDIFHQVDNTVSEGLLICKTCRRYFPIIKGIPIMSPDEYRETKFELPFLLKWQDRLPKDFENFRGPKRLDK